MSLKNSCMMCRGQTFDQGIGSFSKTLRPFLTNLSTEEIKFVESAFNFAKEAHSGQKRISGEEYFSHPLSVAKNISKHQPDANTISAALLHDVVEDCGVGLITISEKFNSEVANIVDGVTKISSIDMKDKALTLEFSKNHFTSQLDSYRKLLTAMAGDPRVLIVKLYDRLHNVQTLEWLSAEKRYFYARETIEIYAALAERIGMAGMKSELEDLSFPYSHPDEYENFIKTINQAKSNREKYIKKILYNLKKNFPEAEIQGRAKHNYSIFNKLQSTMVVVMM